MIEHESRHFKRETQLTIEDWVVYSTASIAKAIFFSPL